MKTIQKILHLNAYSAPWGSLYTLFREYMYNKCLSYVVVVGIGNQPNRLQMGYSLS